MWAIAFLSSKRARQVELTVNELREKLARRGFSVTKKESMELLATGYLVDVATNPRDRNTEKATHIPKEILDKLKPFSKQIL